MNDLVKKSPGRPSLYDPKVHLSKIKKFMTQGQKTLTQVAAHLGIGRKTLWRWEKEYPEVEAALEIGKTYGEAHLTDVLYQIATGKIKGNPTAAMMILNNCYGWQMGRSEGNTYIQNNVTLSYNEINDELRRYLDKMGVENLKDLQDHIVDAEIIDDK